MKKYLLIILLFILNKSIVASHITGGELTYSNVSGNIYKINLDLYADCEMKFSMPTFGSLDTVAPLIKVYKNGILDSVIYLDKVSGGIVDVFKAANPPNPYSSCYSQTSIIKGVYLYTYAKEIDLKDTCSNWELLFCGTFKNGSTAAGKSLAITNVNIASNGPSYLLSLKTMLNNAIGINNSPRFQTNCVPLQQINEIQDFKPDVSDADGDSLVFSLIPSLDSNGLSVNYITPFSAAAPLLALSNTFVFNSSNGRIIYTPNAIQKSLVCLKVEEYRNGGLVGITIREMIFYVFNGLNNLGLIINNDIGIVNLPNHINIYDIDTASNFEIDLKDSFLNNINVEAYDLPDNATVTVLNNDSNYPRIFFRWKPTGGFLLGDYHFFLKVKDLTYPFVKNQTSTFFIHVIEKPISITTKKVDKNFLHLSPNPTSDVLDIRHNLSNANALTIYDFTGKLVAQYNNISSGLQINTKQFKKGNYILKLTSKDNYNSISEKLLIH